MASSRLCMIPSRPIRGRACAIAAGADWRRGCVCNVGPSLALSVDVLVALPERVDVMRLERLDGAERAREVQGARDVLAHDGGLDRLARARADREDAVAAHEEGGGAGARGRLGR